VNRIAHSIVVIVCLALGTGHLHAKEHDAPCNCLWHLDLGVGVTRFVVVSDAQGVDSNTDQYAFTYVIGWSPTIYKFGDSNWALGVNTSLSLSSVPAQSPGGSLMSVHTPLLASLKYENDARCRLSPGWTVGCVLSIGIAHNTWWAPNDRAAEYSNSTYPAMAIELTLGNSDWAFLSLIRIRGSLRIPVSSHTVNTMVPAQQISVLLSTGY